MTVVSLYQKGSEAVPPPRRAAGGPDRETDQPRSAKGGTFIFDPIEDSTSGRPGEVLPEQLSTRLSVPEIARRLNVGRLAVYGMLERGLLPGIRLGRRWLVTRYAFERWERTCGERTGLLSKPEPR